MRAILFSLNSPSSGLSLLVLLRVKMGLDQCLLQAMRFCTPIHGEDLRNECRIFPISGRYERACVA